DTAASARPPLVAIGELQAVFAWTEVLSGRIRRVGAEDVTIYLRSGSRSPLSLLDQVLQQFHPGPPAESTGGTPPPWIDTFHVQGRIRSETITGLVSAKADWPLAVQGTMAGDRPEPAWQLQVAIGDVRQLPEKIEKKPAGVVTKPIPRADAD